MPFARRAHIELVNVSKSQVKGLSWRVEHAPFSSPFDDVGSFAAIYTEANLKPGDLDTTLLDATGSGKIVGVVVSERGPKSSSFLEGNDRFVVDGRRTFSVSGTGTEDLFNGGWYFKHGVFALPTHGCSAIASDANGAAYAMHRFFLSDSMPYADGARFSLQHGPLDDDAVTAWTLTYVYRSEPRLHRTDHLEIGDPASEAAHAYAVTGETWSGSRTQAFEGEHDQEPLTANGRAHRGTSSFSMAVNPNNRGVFLRRMFD